MLFRSQALTRSGFGTDTAALPDEVTLSRILGIVWSSDRNGEEAFGLGLVDYARQTRTPTAVALARALAVVGTFREVAVAAADAADALVAAGLPEPAWAPPVGAVSYGRCWAHEDVFGDVTTLLCEFAYGPQLRDAVRHAIVVQVDHAAASAATDVSLVDDAEAEVRELQYGAGPHHAVRVVDADWAGAILSRAFARTDLVDGVRVEPGFAPLRALAMARAAALPIAADALPYQPAATTAHCVAVVEEFLRSTDGQALDGDVPAEVRRLGLVEFGARHDPSDPARVSPAKWETFVYDWLPEPPSPFAADVMRAWSAWGGRRSGLPQLARDELARSLDELLDPGQRPDG